MKYLYLLLTLLIEILLVRSLKLLDNPDYIMLIFILILIIGIALRFGTKGSVSKDLGWGILAGSLIALVTVSGLFMYLMFSFPQ